LFFFIGSPANKVISIAYWRKSRRKLIHEEHLITTYSAASLTLAILNDYVWKNANHIDLKTLWKYLTNYLYLPRLKNEQVLLDAIAEGVGKDLCSWQENFAYASGYDEGIGNGKAVQSNRDNYKVDSNSSTNRTLLKPNSSTTTMVEPLQPKKRFYGSIELDSLRLIGHSQQIADEVLQHLTSLVGASVKVTLEIEAQVTGGIPDNVIRTVSENCQTLNFKSQGFEED
jgi:hypothetical protein